MECAKKDAIFVEMSQRLSSHDLQSLSEGIHAIQHHFKRHCSLGEHPNMFSQSSSSIHDLIELYVFEFLKDHLIGLKEYLTSVTDFLYKDVKLAFRIISGRSGLLLEKQNKRLASPSCKGAWKHPILVLNIQTEDWYQGEVKGTDNLCLLIRKEESGLRELSTGIKSKAEDCRIERPNTLASHEQLQSTESWKEEKRYILIDQGFYIIVPPPRNAEKGAEFEGYICEKRLHDLMLDAKRDGLFTSIPRAVGLKRFSICHGLQWK